MSNSERIRPPWWLKYVNKAMIGVQKLGVNFGPVLLTAPGRKSGKPRSTPVTPMTVDGNRYIVGEFEALAGPCPVFRLDPVTP